MEQNLPAETPANEGWSLDKGSAAIGFGGGMLFAYAAKKILDWAMSPAEEKETKKEEKEEKSS